MDCILIINVGSATLKFAIFQANKSLTKVCSGNLDTRKQALKPKDLFNWIKHSYPAVIIKVIGHRVVHGGKNFLGPALITKPVLSQLKKLIQLAPLHMPQEIDFIEKVSRGFPKIKQVACFDTAFHRTQSRLATLFAIPRKYIEKDGIIRYGFHGLSYEYISHKLYEHTKKKSNKAIVAHLGNGASLCAINQNKSVATSMGFSALDGLVMGTRCGSIDPGVLIYLMVEKGLSVKELERLLYKESGLLGISGITSDVKELLENKSPRAKEALDLFCYRAIREIGSLIAILGGLDVLVFTGGIGEKAAMIRENICSGLNWLGLTIDKNKNRRNSMTISTTKSKVEVYIIPTNEELMIAKHALDFIKIT
jgi:acetate kinase